MILHCQNRTNSIDIIETNEQKQQDSITNRIFLVILDDNSGVRAQKIAEKTHFGHLWPYTAVLNPSYFFAIYFIHLHGSRVNVGHPEKDWDSFKDCQELPRHLNEDR